MWLKSFLIFLLLFVIIRSENHLRRRRGRFLTFNTLDNSIEVQLDFSVPFLSIPVRKTIDAFGLSEFPMININPAALALGGAVVLGTTVLAPLLLKTYAAHAGDRYSRILDNTEFGSDLLINFTHEMLSDPRNIRGCALRLACWVAKGNLMEPTKIISQLASNPLISSFVNSTAIDDAILSGINGRDCMTYTPCPLREEYIPVIINNIATFTNARKK